MVTSLATVKTIVLPGMDGTGKLLRRFCESAPASHTVSSAALPPTSMDYRGLACQMADCLPSNEGVLLIAESFSGPLAVHLAADQPHRVLGIVLVATFVDAPVSWLAKLVPWSVVFRLPLPGFAARWALIGGDASEDEIREIQAVVRGVPRELMADRVKKVIGVDATSALERCQCPLLYIRPTADRLVPERCWKTIHRLRPDAKFAAMDGPHLILQRKPSEAWQHIAEFTKHIAGGNPND